ncbi:hypothetical protein QFZ82_007383 [Streptomyces sp. V4I23]|nr:hypothetical protein [Streptomyces sp. V4I23]
MTMMKVAAAADLYPVAIGTDCVVYPSDGPSPLDFLPRTPDGKQVPGGFRLGVSPGMVKHEGTQTRTTARPPTTGSRSRWTSSGTAWTRRWRARSPARSRSPQAQMKYLVKRLKGTEAAA